MSQPTDPLELAMQALKARSREPAAYDVNLEKRIMQEFGNMQVRSKRRWKIALAAAAAFAVSGVGFAASGGMRMIEGWFGRVELVDPSGESDRITMELQGTELVDENGNVVGEISVAGEETSRAK